MRWIVGDVQGCARELERLLAEIRFDPSRDELWSTGDLVSRGPDSAAAVRLWRDAGGRGVIGNHDVNLLLVAAGCREPRDPTQRDLLDAPDAAELLGLLRDLPLLARLPGAGVPDVRLVHAGLHPAWSDPDAVAARLNPAPHDEAWLTHEDVSFATRVRCCTREGNLCRETGPPEECRAPYRPWDAFYGGRLLVVHGHWARRGHYRGRRTLGLDSGCVYGGALTAWCHEEDRVVQVPAAE